MLEDDYLARCMGIRSTKYYLDRATSAASRMSGNDMPIFRVSRHLFNESGSYYAGSRCYRR